jgi:hypothetical protein
MHRQDFARLLPKTQTLLAFIPFFLAVFRILLAIFTIFIAKCFFDLAFFQGLAVSPSYMCIQKCCLITSSFFYFFIAP